MKRFKGKISNSDTYEINVITSDITYMKDSYCIAGWSPYSGQMKRLMIEGHHWKEHDLKKLGKYASLNVKVIPGEGGRNYPHKTEDIRIAPNFKIIHHYEDPKWLVKDLRNATSNTIQDIFGDHLQKNSYVPFGAKCSSLGGVILPSKNITFFREDGKLRVRIIDVDLNEYNLRVTCKYLRDVIDALSSKQFEDFKVEMLELNQKAHVRVGLARPYVYKDNNCYLMCNGIFFCND